MVWWMSQVPYAGIFDNRIAAEAAANVRNAILVEVKGTVVSVHDWYRRDNSGKPMPAEWRELQGQIHIPWMPRTT